MNDIYGDRPSFISRVEIEKEKVKDFSTYISEYDPRYYCNVKGVYTSTILCWFNNFILLSR